MRIQQLREGQKEQIQNLRKSSPVLLFHPTGIRDAVGILRKDSTERPELLVTPSLKSSMKRSNVVIKFWGRGKDLYPPREVRKSRGDNLHAKELYPESFRPLVSFALMQQNPKAFYQGELSSGNIEAIIINNDGTPEVMTPRQFGEWYVSMVRNKKLRQQQG